MEDAYKIIGGTKLKGEVILSGAKNVALKTMIAALLFDGKVTLHNVPKINDVTELLHIVTRLGVSASFVDTNLVEIDSTTMTNNKVDMFHSSKIRVSFMLFAPLLHKFKKCYVPNPGGCRIGARPIHRIIDGMKALGVEVSYDSTTGYYEAELKGDIGGEYTFDKPSHTGTELLIMLATRGNGTSILRNAALEPEIDELIAFLNAAGARIKKEQSTITIQGVAALEQKEPFTIGNDRNEAVTFAVMGVATGGEVTLKNIDMKTIAAFVDAARKAQVGIEVLGDGRVRFYSQGNLQAVSIETTPHPGFMTDWQPNWAVLMTQATGDSIIHERVFENRFAYVSELRKLGAKIAFIQPDVPVPNEFYFFDVKQNNEYDQAIKIHGPTALHNGFLSIHDLRAGASVLIGALAASGESTVQGASIVERGYENFVEKIQRLGGSIEKI
jgi:UDP-N-acetylglucosamine 1-carboxyvinyltransferase